MDMAKEIGNMGNKLEKRIEELMQTKAKIERQIIKPENGENHLKFKNKEVAERIEQRENQQFDIHMKENHIGESDFENYLSRLSRKINLSTIQEVDIGLEEDADTIKRSDDKIENMLNELRSMNTLINKHNEQKEDKDSFEIIKDVSCREEKSLQCIQLNFPIKKLRIDFKEKCDLEAIENKMKDVEVADVETGFNKIIKAEFEKYMRLERQSEDIKCEPKIDSNVSICSFDSESSFMSLDSMVSQNLDEKSRRSYKTPRNKFECIKLNISKDLPDIELLLASLKRKQDLENSGNYNVQENQKHIEDMFRESDAMGQDAHIADHNIEPDANNTIDEGSRKNNSQHKIDKNDDTTRVNLKNTKNLKKEMHKYLNMTQTILDDMEHKTEHLKHLICKMKELVSFKYKIMEE